jgi:hypothetical protein
MTAPPINLAELRAMAEDGAKYEVATDRVYPSMASTDLLALLDAVEAARQVNEAIKQSELTPEGSNLDLRAVVALGQALSRFQP